MQSDATQDQGTTPRRPQAGRDRAALLAKAVEQEVIPRLLAAHAAPDQAATITQTQVQTLAALAMQPDGLAAEAFVSALQAEGVAAEAVCLDLLAPTARLLGDMWVDDDCDFTDVTTGLLLLHRCLRALRLGEQPEAGAAAPRALLTTLPGADHVFGMAVVAEFFRHAGWHAWSGTVDSVAELTGMLRATAFDTLGLTLSCEVDTDEVRQLIAAARAASRNPALIVMVGGHAVDPALAKALGADGTAADALGAVRTAGALLALRQVCASG